MSYFKYALAAAAFGLGGQASAAVLDFSGAICGGACVDADFIDQSYGDIAGELDITYDGDTTVAGNQGLRYWSTGYETLVDVAYNNEGNIGSSLTINFAAAAGYGVRLLGLDFANYLNRANSTSFSVVDTFDNSTIFALPTTTPETDCGSNDICSFAFAGGILSSNSGLLLTFGPDAYNTGIDNVRYETFRLNTTPIPLPASALLLLGGLAGLGALRSRS